MESQKISSLYLCFSALNHFYYLSDKCLDYESLLENFNLIMPDEITFVEKHILESLINKNIKFIFYSKEQNFLRMDKKIIDLIEIKKFEKKYLLETEMIEFIKSHSPKEFIVLDESINSLSTFNQLGCWTILLTSKVFSHIDINDSVIASNIEYLNNGGEKFFDFVTNNFYQLSFYYEEIKKINLENKDSTMANHNILKDIINSYKPKFVLILLRKLRNYKQFLKMSFFISDENILYTTHIGGNDISVNERFDCILAKAVEVKDLIYYSCLLDNTVKFCQQKNIPMLNNISGLKYFVEKDLMGEYLLDFINSKPVQNLMRKFSTNILYPKSINLNILQVLDKTFFVKTLKSNKINFPILIKYKGKATHFKHLNSFVISEESLDSLVLYLSELNISEEEEKEATVLVIQPFHNHGGKILKLYRINKELYFVMRPSLPDFNIHFQEKYSNELITFKTTNIPNLFIKCFSTLQSEEMFENFQKKIKEFESFFKELANFFEQHSGFTLFGIDIIYAYEQNNFYILDCNSTPSYKIKDDIASKFRQHFITYLSN
jgi:hypothetical protein